MSDRSKEISGVIRKASFVRLFFHFFAPATIIMMANIQQKYGTYSSSKQEIHQLGPAFLPFVFIALGLIALLQALYYAYKRPNGTIKKLAKRDPKGCWPFIGKKSPVNARRSIIYILLISGAYAACACYGFFLMMIGHDLNWFIPFVAMTVLGFFSI